MTKFAGGEPFLKRWWRPAMALQYFAVCIFDFIIFPGVRELTFAAGGTFHEWKSLTLSNGGLYHAAMGAICGVYAWQKTKELMAQTGGASFTERTTERSVTQTVPAADGAPDQPQPPQSGKSSRAD